MAFPTIKVEYVDLEKMVERHRWEVDQMKTLFGFHYPEGTVFKVVKTDLEANSIIKLG